MADFVLHAINGRLTGREIQPHTVDIGVLPQTPQHAAFVYVQFDRPADFWVLTPSEARQAAAAFEALALKAEGRKVS